LGSLTVDEQHAVEVMIVLEDARGVAVQAVAHRLAAAVGRATIVTWRSTIPAQPDRRQPSASSPVARDLTISGLTTA
jgi:hypothetical protein